MTPTPAPAADVLTVGAVTLDLARQVVRLGADDVRLRPKTFDVLTMLVRHAGQVVSVAWRGSSQSVAHTAPRMTFSRLTLLDGVAQQSMIPPDREWVACVSDASGIRIR